MAKKRGRNRKPGERYASGKLKLKPTGEPVAPAIWDRIKRDAIARASDPRAGSEVGRLGMNREISGLHVMTAFKVAEIYGAFERLEGIKRSCRSASYESGLRGEGGIDEMRLTEGELEKLIKRQADTKAAFLSLNKEMMKFPIRMRDMLERLCVEDRAVLPMELDGVRIMLDRLATFFGVTSSSRRAPQARQQIQRRAPPVKPKPRVDFTREAAIAVMRHLRRDMTEEQLEAAYEVQRALKDRAMVRRSKEAKLLTAR